MYNDVVTLLVEKTIRDEIGMKQTFYERIGESVYREVLPNGLQVCVVPKPEHAKKYAFFATPYGEYEQEEVLRFRGRLYSVYRFRNDFHHTELYCEARSGLQ